MQPPRTRGHLVLMGGSVRAATESAARDGWEVSAVDMFGDVDCRKSARRWHALPSPDRLRPLLQSLPPGPLIVTGGMEQWYEHLDEVREDRPVLAPATSVIRRLRDPFSLRDLAQTSGLDFPPIQPANATDLPPGWLIKSRRSTAGLSVAPACPSPTACNSPPDPDAYFQQRVSGRPFGAAFLASDSETHLIGAARSLTYSLGRHPFLYAGSLGPVRIEAECQQKLMRLVESLRSELELRGLFGVDLLADPVGQRLWLLEINPRITASMELFEPASGPSLITRHAAAMGYIDPASEPIAMDPQTAALPLHLKRIVWSRAALQWNPEWEQTAARSDVRLRDIPQPGSLIAPGQPIVSLHTTGRTISEIRRKVRRFQGAGFREQDALTTEAQRNGDGRKIESENR